MGEWAEKPFKKKGLKRISITFSRPRVNDRCMYARPGGERGLIDDLG